jgi:hypothetical protein
MRDEIGLHRRLRRQEAIERDRRDGLAGGSDAKLLGEALGHQPRVLARNHVVRSPALEDGAAEQPLGSGHGQQRADAHRPGRMAKESDVVGIPTEGGDILPHRLQSGDLIEQTKIGTPLAQIEESLGPDPVINGHADDAIAGEAAAVVRRPRSGLEHAAGEVHHDGKPTDPRSGVQTLRFRQSSPSGPRSGMSTSHGGG